MPVSAAFVSASGDILRFVDAEDDIGRDLLLIVISPGPVVVTHVSKEAALTSVVGARASIVAAWKSFEAAHGHLVSSRALFVAARGFAFSSRVPARGAHRGSSSARALEGHVPRRVRANGRESVDHRESCCVFQKRPLNAEDAKRWGGGTPRRLRVPRLRRSACFALN